MFSFYFIFIVIGHVTYYLLFYVAVAFNFQLVAMQNVWFPVYENLEMKRIWLIIIV